MRRMLGCFVILLTIHLNLSANETDNNKTSSYEEFHSYTNQLAEKYCSVFYLSVDHPRAIALTFDDGPDGKNTSKILDILNNKGVKATFFVVGMFANIYPKTIMRIVADGHEIGNHSWSHQDFRAIDNRHIINKELHPTSELIEKITDVYPKILRPPYGAIREDTIKYLASSGWKIINWSVDSYDWQRDISVDDIKKQVTEYIHPGGIILFHSSIYKDNTVLALTDIIEDLINQGYIFLTVSELLSSAVKTLEN